MFRVKSPQDLATALTFVTIGLIGLVVGQDYEFGSAAKMGPGYFPVVLSLLLIATGLFLGVRSLTTDGQSIPMPNFRSVAFVVSVIILFGLSIPRFGLFSTIALCTLLATFASIESRWRESIALSLGLATFIAVLFIVVLGQPMTWFGG